MCLWYWQVFKGTDFFLEKTNMSSAAVFVLLWRGLSYFQMLFSCLLLDEKLSFLTFSIFVTLKHTVVSRVHSNTHIPAAVSMHTLFVQRLDQSGKQVTSGDSESIKTLSQLQLLTVNDITQHKVQISSTYWGSKCLNWALLILAMHLTQLNTGSYCAIYRNIAATDLRGFNIVFPHM